MGVVEFAGQSTQDAGNVSASTSRLMNCYREPTGAGRQIIRNAPGITEAFGEPPRSGLVALTHVINDLGGDTVYGLAGGQLIEYDAVTSPEYDFATEGQEDISTNTGRLTIVIGGDYFVYNVNTLSMTGPLTGAFTDMGSVEYLAGYTLISELDGRRIQWSALATPGSLPALNFASAEQTDEDITRLMVAQDLLWVFKPSGAEIWQNTGQADDLAFAYVLGSAQQVGLRSFRLAAKMLDSIGFVGSDNVVYVTVGTGLRPISPPAVHVALTEGQPENCVYFEHLGHKFFCIVFADRPAWVYDVATGEWHERALFPDYQTWPIRASVRVGGNWYLGNEAGQVGLVDGTNEEFGRRIARQMISKTLDLENPARVKRLEFRGETGATGTIMLRLSGDGARTWGRERTITLGATGVYDNRMVFRALGRYRRLTAEITMTDGVDVPIYADAILETA